MAGDPTPLFATINVGIGGAIGAACRYQLGRAIANLTGPGAGFPWPTFAVNVLGCLAMGLLFGWLAKAGHGNESLRQLLGVGLLGGFTTFSAFGLEMVQLTQRGAIGLAALYAAGSVLIGVAALYAGLLMMRAAT